MYVPNCMKSFSIYAIFHKFWVVAQKPPGGHEGVTRRHISFIHFLSYVMNCLTMMNYH